MPKSYPTPAKRPVAPLFHYKVVRLNPTRVKLIVRTRDNTIVGTNSFPTEEAAITGFNKGDYFPIQQPF